MGNDLGSATFDLSDVQAADFEGESALSVQGTITLKISWAPAKVLKKSEMFVKHKGDVVTSMGKYVKHEFTLWYAQNNGGSGGGTPLGSRTAWPTKIRAGASTTTLCWASRRRTLRDTSTRSARSSTAPSRCAA